MVYSGYVATVPGFAGSWLSFLFYGAGLWAIVNLARGRRWLVIPRRSLAFIFSGLTYFAILQIAGIASSGLAGLPYLNPAAFLFAPLLIGRYRSGSPLASWETLCRWAPLGAALGLAALFITGTQSGGAGNASVLGIVMAVLGILSLAGVFSPHRQAKWIALAGTCLAFVGVIWSGTRTLYPCIILVPAVAAICIGRLQLRWVALAAVVLAVLGFANLDKLEHQWRITKSDIQMIEAQRSDSSMATRLALWSGALEAISDRPVLGYGPHEKMSAVRSRLDRRMSGMTFTHVHNVYLDTMVAAGAVGLVALLAVLLTPLLMVWGSFDERKDRRFVVMSVVGTFALFGLTGPLFTHDLITVLFVLPLVLVAASDPKESDADLWPKVGAR